jgi:hypothetical protein
MITKKFWMAATAGCLLTVSAIAQTTPSSSASGNDNHVSLAAGAVLQAELTKSIDAKKAKSGDEVSARLTLDLKTSDGKIVMHRGSKLVGHVTEAQAKSKENAESKLGMVFEKAVAKDGQEIAFNGLIQALRLRYRPLLLWVAMREVAWARAAAEAIPWAAAAAVEASRR